MGLCQVAYDLTLTFRSSTIEYEWDQDAKYPSTFTALNKLLEVVGNQGPDSGNEKPFRVVFLVFCRVLKGNRTSVLLNDSKDRLLPTDLVKVKC